jgi:hypothetical protein
MTLDVAGVPPFRERKNLADQIDSHEFEYLAGFEKTLEEGI